MRCLSLAEKLRELGAEVLFATATLPGDLIGHIESEGYRALALDSPDISPVQLCWGLAELGIVDFDLLVVDHYAVTRRWESAMRPVCRRILVIDDLANRHHDCDLLVDQNRPSGSADLYSQLVPEHCEVLAGTQYCLLSRYFAEARRTLRSREGSLDRILICFGGGDPTGEWRKALAACAELDGSRVRIDVVAGRSSPHAGEMSAAAAALPNCRFVAGVEDMAALMAEADLGIGAGGTMTWERCCVGLPSLAVQLAENQEVVIEAASSAGAIVDLGGASASTAETYKRAIQTLDGTELQRMSRAGLDLVDGLGTQRVADAAIVALGDAG